MNAALNTTTPLLLICFHHAGGGTANYYRWRRALPASVELLPVALPGHDGRLNETLFSDLRKLTSWLTDELREKIHERPFVLLGHSMGAWLAFELARELRRRRRPAPKLLIAAASRPPDTLIAGSRLHLMPDDELVASVDQLYNGIPPALRNHPELLKLMLPAIRADLQLIETYEYAEEPPLDVDVLALGGSDDPAVTIDQLNGWRRHTASNFAVRLFPGGHFFLFLKNSPVEPAGIRLPTQETPALRAILTRLQLLLDESQSESTIS